MAKDGRNKGKAGTCPSKSPVLPCQQRFISGRFDKPQVKCGDRVGLVAAAVNIPDGTTTTFNIKQYGRGTQVATESAKLKNWLVTKKYWISKKVFRGWAPPDVVFKVSAGGTSAMSDNKLKFYKYPDFAAYTWSVTRNAPNHGINYVVKGKYDIEFKNSVLIITVKIKLLNFAGKQLPAGAGLPPLKTDKSDPPKYVPVSNKKKRSMKLDIESKLSGKWLLHRDQCLRGPHCKCLKNRECCKFKVKIKVEFVENNPHHEVNLFWGSNIQVDAKNWGRKKWRANDYAHETGHLLGWYDEYDGPGNRGAIAPASDRPPWKKNRVKGIMNVGLQVPKVYYRDFKGQFRLKTSEPWELVKK